MDKEKVLSLLREGVTEAGTITAWAKRHDISVPYVSDVLAGRRDPGAKILAALGLERTIIYKKESNHE